MVVTGEAFFVVLEVLRLSLSSVYTPAACGLILLQNFDQKGRCGNVHIHTRLQGVLFRCWRIVILCMLMFCWQKELVSGLVVR